MKTTSRRVIVETIKREYKEARTFCRGDRGRYYRMMIDLEDGDIWADVFLDVNSWKEYHSGSIHQLMYVPGYIADTEKAYIDDAIRQLTDAGWAIREED